MAGILGCDKNSVSRIERGDLAGISLPLLRAYIGCFGGTLQIDANFPDTAHHLPVDGRYDAAFGHLNPEPGPGSVY
ncbi:hypothetical protein Csp1_11740 [Corynebacterium provencense]|jgi:hypothetical protein|uniref:Uncharacterized protein n=1 Tax=Corynebacterium provencense TaxID=1737425 RepID=A0A2Z3YTN1_9CORY|nr:helix-turn-helix transcriptional regulator [Corynebacterium provencense]AWT25974.1 hypothetical protein Csp1_11740 [Corynebacterium provencense]MCI1255976.1 helix-turn-helix transcriptional regulator [Corynebacterium provencense]